MSSFLNAATAYLGEELKAHESETVVYRRGASVVTGGIAATIGETRYELSNEAGGAIALDSCDFIVQAADLVISSVQTEPRKGDQIDRTVGGQTLTYEVMTLDNDQHFAYCDRGKTRIRVRAKKVGVA